MKILFSPTHYVFDDGERGSELSWAFQIVNTVATQNTESLIVTGFKNTKRKSFPYRIIELQKEKKAVDLGLVNSLLFNLLYSRFSFSTVHKESFDIVHHVLPFGVDRTFNLFFLFTNNKKFRKVIGPIQNQIPVFEDNIHDMKHDLRNPLLVILEKILITSTTPLLRYASTKTLQAADTVIVINQFTKKLLIKRGVKKDSIVIIPPGVDCRVFTPDLKETPHDKPIELISVGTLMQRKGYDVLLKGIAEVVKTNKNIVLRIVGDGPQRKNLEALCETLGITQYVVFEGHVAHSQMNSYYKRAEVFVSMSRAEGFATVCLEAMASGLVIISSKVGGFTDVIRDNENGYLVDQEDFQQLSVKLRSIITHKALRKKIGLRARQDAETLYDWNTVIIPKYISIYKELLK